MEIAISKILSSSSSFSDGRWWCRCVITWFRVRLFGTFLTFNGRDWGGSFSSVRQARPLSTHRRWRARVRRHCAIPAIRYSWSDNDESSKHNFWYRSTRKDAVKCDGHWHGCVQSGSLGCKCSNSEKWAENFTHFTKYFTSYIRLLFQRLLHCDSRRNLHVLRWKVSWPGQPPVSVSTLCL